MLTNSIIESTGSYIPNDVISNQYFLDRNFLDDNGKVIPKENSAIISKLEEITQIKERRYENKLSTVGMASNAAEAALAKSSILRESLGGIIVAHNFGDIHPKNTQGHMIPNLAARVKNQLGIKNSKCFAFDVLFGCPGWLLAMDQAHQYLQNGVTDSIMVIGVESLSRVVDPNDIDAMLFGDGAGAVILKAEKSEQKKGILAYESYSDCDEEVEYLTMDHSRSGEGKELYIKMIGRSVFKYAVNKVPQVITDCLKSLSIPLQEISNFLFHQANGKMLDAIGSKLSELNDAESIQEKVPITLDWLGNTSVATIPTLLDMITRKEMNGFSFEKGDKVVMASVGAGMHANCMVYQY